MNPTNKSRTLYVNLPEETHRAAKACAAYEGRLLGDVVADAISSYVASRFPQFGLPKNSKDSKFPKSPKPPRQPPATTGPGSPGYVAPPSLPAGNEDEECLSEELPPARDDENPFADDVLDSEQG